VGPGGVQGDGEIGFCEGNLEVFSGVGVWLEVAHPDCHITRMGGASDGTALAEDGAILNPTRIEWEPGGVFVTPPGHWHAHVNESGRIAHLLPIQDAGLHTYLRSLDIRFTA
jgi:hypothetical protein